MSEPTAFTKLALFLEGVQTRQKATWGNRMLVLDDLLDEAQEEHASLQAEVERLEKGVSLYKTAAAKLEGEVERLNKTINSIPPVPEHQADNLGIDCPNGGPGPWDHDECDCGYWGRLEAWAKKVAALLSKEGEP